MMAEAEIVDFQSCCRLCLTEIVESIKSIFDETVEDRRLSVKIQQSVAIKINTSDRLSTKVCEPCIEKVTGWYNYKEQCLQNQKKLEDWINSKSAADPTESTVTPELTPAPELTAAPELPPAPELTVAPELIVAAELNSSYNSSSSTSIADMTLQIKEEPQDHIEEPQDHVLQEDVLNNPLDTLDSELDQQNDIRPELIHHNHVLVKTEPLYMDGLDEPMEEEYSEFPPTLSPHHLENGDDLQEPLVVRTSAFNRTCSICGKLFSNAGNKKKHERMQHGLHNNLSIATPIINGLSNGDGIHGSPVQTEQQQILKTMSFKVLKTTPIETPENLTKIENSYGEKCKAMVSMHKSLICACHNVPHQNLKGLLSHLRALRIWFPVFTCYNCMITFTDRSTFTRHISRCQSAPLDTITKLSELKIRTEVKTRLYQNFKCTICKFMFSFHEHFCKHVDEDHAMLQFPVHCPCGKTCETEEEYKDHVYVSCLVEFYCDICFVTTKTLDDFQKHAAGVHDDSEGFILLQDDNYKVRKPSMHISPTGVDEGAIIQGKRERKASFKTPLYDEELDEILPTSLASATYYTPKTANINRVCPICYKEYSSYKNMMRHFKTHKTEEIVNPQEQQLEHGFGDFQDFQDQSQESQDMDLEDEESFYSCPDCGGMFSTIEWKIHLTEKHQSKACGECGKFFQFQTELDQHRSVHLNLKVYRDSKTQSYKSTMISPGGEDDEMLGCEMCDLIFTSKEDLMTHQLEQGHAGTSSMEVPEIKPEITTAPKKYICDICEQEFNNYNGLWEHNRTRHPERKTPHADTYPKQCKDCDKVCTTGAAYYRHRQIHEKIPTDAGASKASLLKPKKSGEPDEESYHTCKRCFKVFSSKYNLKNHLKCHGININPVSKKLVRKAVCKVCQHVFDTNEELIRHKQEAHNSVETPIDDMDMASLVFPCDTCVMTFNSKVALKKHKEKHNLEYKSLHRQVYCKYCKISFENFQSLTKHMQLEHDEKVTVPPKAKPNDFTCSICQKSFQSAGALTTHIGWHKRALNDSSSKLLKHVPPPLPPPAPAVQLPRLHQVNIKEEPMDDVSKYQCDTCLAELPNDTALQVHILEKHRSVSAIMLIPRCNTCNKDFATQDEYETHKRLHDFLERQKQHEQKMLVQQESPSSRMSQASKQKSFPCKHCNAAFSRSDTLGAHIRQFHKEHVQTEFKCNQCDRVFEKQNSLTIHLKVHEKQRAATAPAGKPLFSCSICNMGFDLPKDLRAHTITAHPF